METIELTLTLEEANLILEALGDMPFKEVFELIGKIQQQASEQLQDNAGSMEPSGNGFTQE
ncbi:MAG: hypothetical protein AAF399_07185 [Bacteroidota bacterium]